MAFDFGEYTSIELSSSSRVRFTFNCIGKGRKAGYVKGSVDCGEQTLNIQIPDRYVKEFVGLKFIVDDSISRWVYDSSLYN